MPLGHSMHAEKVKQFLQCDYPYKGPSPIGYEYIILMQDDIVPFSVLYPFEKETAKSVSKALVKYLSSYSGVPTWISDAEAHFKTQLIAAMNKALPALRVRHSSTSNSTQVNGTVARLYEEVLRRSRSFISELPLKETECFKTLPMIQSALNHSK